jgi:hypothetical protein
MGYTFISIPVPPWGSFVDVDILQGCGYVGNREVVTYPQHRPVDPVGNRDVIHKYTGSSRCEWLLRALIALRGLWISALEFSVGIFDPHVVFEQATEFERAKVDVPDTVIDLLESHVFSGADDANVDPIPLPTDAPVEAHVAHLEVAGVVEWGQL